MRLSLVIVAVVACSSKEPRPHAPAVTAADKLQIAFELDVPRDVIPEGIAYDPVTERFFLSSTYRRKVITIAKDGTPSDFTAEAQDGLLGVIGMRVDAKRRHLWVANMEVGDGMPIRGVTDAERGRTAVHKYNVDTGAFLAHYAPTTAAGRAAFNDLTLDRSGNVYITDTMGGAIYKVDAAGTLAKLVSLPEGMHPNGIDITPEDRYLFVAFYSKPHGYLRIDLRDNNKIERLELPADEDAGADGLYFDRNTLIGILPYDETEARKLPVRRYHLDESLKRVTRVEALLGEHALLSQPTTGVVVRDSLYFVATSNLQRFQKAWNANQGVVDLSTLAPVRVGVLPLR